MPIIDTLNIPTGWRETTLGEVAENIAYGYTESASFEEIGPKFLRITDIQDDFINWETVPYCPISEKDYKKYKLEVGDIVIARTGNSTGATSTIKQPVDAVFASYLIRFRLDNKKADYKFVDFLIRSDAWRCFVKSVKGGSAQGGANAKNFAGFPILLPPLPEQQAIANMLTSFDNKIELLRGQNKTLEATTQTIFQEWFGKYTVNDELPEGWKVQELDTLLDLIIDYRGKTPKKLGMDWSDSGIPALSAKSIKGGKIVREDAMNYGSEELYSIWMKDKLQKGDILITSEAPLGEMYYLSDEKKYILSQRLFALRVNKEVTSEYIYYYLSSPTGQHLLTSRASGSTVEGIRQSELRKIKVIIPSHEELYKISPVLRAFLQKKAINEKEINLLGQTRDELLPRLMSGGVRLKKI